MENTGHQAGQEVLNTTAGPFFTPVNHRKYVVFVSLWF